MRSRRVLAEKMLGEVVRFRRVLVQRPCEVPEGFGGEDAR